VPSYHYPEDLPCYQLAREFRIQVAKFCSRLPQCEEYRLKDQMLRAARSATANIAEGFGRHHHQENLQYCRQARGSLFEMRDHLNVASDENFGSKEEIDRLFSLLEEAIHSLNGYIGYLKQCLPQKPRSK